MKDKEKELNSGLMEAVQTLKDAGSSKDTSKGNKEVNLLSIVKKVSKNRKEGK